MPATVTHRSLAALAAASLLLCARLAAAAQTAPSGAVPDAAGSGAAAGSAAAPGEHTLCSEPDTRVALGSAQWNGWGRGPDNTRYQPEPAIRAMDVPKLALRWAFGYSGGAAAGQPTVVDGRLFVASASGRVYSLDAKTGCTYWTFDAQAGVHTAVSIAELAPRKSPPKMPKASKRRRGRHQLIDAHLEMPKAPSAAFFGDDKGAVYALDAQTGALLWKTQIDEHPLARIEGSPTIYLDRVYVGVGSSEPESAAAPGYACCSFRGSVAALDIVSGHIEWKTYLVSGDPQPLESAAGPRFGPAGAAIADAPTVDAARGVVYVGTGETFNPKAQPLADAVVALDLTDGKLRWAKQLADAGGESSPIDASPILRAIGPGKQSLLVGERSGAVYALDPDRAGEILWQIKGPGDAAGGVAWGAAADHRSVFVALSGLDAEPPNPTGSLTAIDVRTGARRWLTAAPDPACSWGRDPACVHGQAQAVTVIPGAAFCGSLDGHLRAYSTLDGKVLWDYDTAKDFTTVNHVKAAGGSLDRGGPTIVNGMVYLNSGSGGRGRAGNVLLAFSVDGK